MNKFKCQIISPQEIFNFPNLIRLQLPTSKGEINILPHHAETFVLLEKGKIQLTFSDGTNKIIRINSGECHIENNQVTIIL